MKLKLPNVTIFRTAEKFAADNAPVLLTAVGVVGTVGTAVLAGKAAYHAANVIRYEDLTRGTQAKDPTTRKEQIKLTWMMYLPAAGVGATTIVAIVFANRISMTRLAAMTAAYGVVSENHEDYKKKVLEKFGANKETAVRDEIAQDRVSQNPPTNEFVFNTGGGTDLCVDAWTGRYFLSSMESIKAAQNDLNYKILANDYASLTEFYGLLGLPGVRSSDDVGWNHKNKFEVVFSTTVSEDNRPAHVVDFRYGPVADYSRSRP